jgi:hypothetical protein
LGTGRKSAEKHDDLYTWLDEFSLIKRATPSSWRMREGKIIKSEVVLKVLDKMTGARLKSAVIRTCAAVGLDWRMELELKAPCLYPWPG